MDVVHHLFPESRIGRAVARGMRWALVSCMLLSVTAALDMQMLVLLREWVRGYRNELDAADEASTWAWIREWNGLGHALFSVWIYIQLVSYFVAACVMHPSRIRPPLTSAGAAASSSPMPKPMIPHAMASTPSMSSDQELDRLCPKCRTMKLLRTHHCAVCNCCVELMDHHCPFTGNCVGRGNFRVFYLWVCYGVAGVCYACVMSFVPFERCFLQPFLAGSGDAKALWQSNHGLLCARLGRASYLFLPAFFGALSTLFIWGMQTLLILRDVTTIEYLKSITSLRIRMQRPEEVRKDEERRRAAAAAAAGAGAGATRRKQASGSSGSGGAAATASSLDFGSDGDEGFELVERDAADMESGTPVAGAGADSAAAAAGGSPLSSSPSSSPRKAAPYNPHKSFRLLVLQNHAWWTMLLPPCMLHWVSPNSARSGSGGEHDQRLHR